MDGPGVVTVFVAALGTALATGLGAVPFVFVKHLPRSRIGIANALAAGFMVAASGLLFYEGGRESLVRLALGASAGWPLRRLGVAPAGRRPRRALRRACGRRCPQGASPCRRHDRSLERRGRRRRGLLWRGKRAGSRDGDRDRDPQHPGGPGHQPAARAPGRAGIASRGLERRSRACPSHSSPFPPTSSSPSSTGWCPSGSASRAARCCGWSPPSSFPRRSR